MEFDAKKICDGCPAHSGTDCVIPSPEIGCPRDNLSGPLRDYVLNAAAKQISGDILQALYDSEINARIDWQWDGGVDWKVLQGYDNCEIVASGTEDTVDEALNGLEAAAIKEYPNSAFAKNRA